MKRYEYDRVFDLADDIIATLNEIDETYPVISVYGHYDVIKSLLEDLIMSGIEIKESIELESYRINYYDKEFVLYLTDEGVSVCKCWKYNGYLYGAGDVSFVHEDCNSKLLKHIDSEYVCEFGIIGESTGEECCCEECCECDKESTVETDGNMHGFSVNKSDENGWNSYSFYSTNINLVEQMARLFR